MKKILITGSTDGIGLATMKMLIETDNHLIVHGRTKEKVDKTINTLKSIKSSASLDGYVADLSDMNQVEELADYLKDKYDYLDVLINNAGVFNIANPISKDGLDMRFVVNTIAPYLLTKLLMPILDHNSRVVNLSSAAQAPVNLIDLRNGAPMASGNAYAQSKLALTMWSHYLGQEYYTTEKTPSFIAVNPKSFLGSKMVQEAYGTQGHDIRIGADILCRASLSEEFSNASGKYFDHDYGKFSNPHPDALDMLKCKNLVTTLDNILEKI